MTASLEVRRLAGHALRVFAPTNGTCMRCEWPWAFVDTHTTSYATDEGGGSHGCFPLCERCWRELGTPADRLPFYKRLLDEWDRESPGYVSVTLREQVRAAVMDGR